MLILTGKEVRRSVAADLKRKGITYEQAAKDLGYKNKQSIANILSSKNDSYLPQEQALRLHITYNYQIDFLTKGIGRLYPDREDPMVGVIDILPPFDNLSREVLTIVIDTAEGIIKSTNNDNAIQAWDFYLKGDYENYKAQMTALSQSTDLKIIPVLSRYACEHIKESLNASYSSMYRLGHKESDSND